MRPHHPQPRRTERHLRVHGVARPERSPVGGPLPGVAPVARHRPAREERHVDAAGVVPLQQPGLRVAGPGRQAEQERPLLHLLQQHHVGVEPAQHGRHRVEPGLDLGGRHGRIERAGIGHLVEEVMDVPAGQPDHGGRVRRPAGGPRRGRAAGDEEQGRQEGEAHGRPRCKGRPRRWEGPAPPPQSVERVDRRQRVDAERHRAAAAAGSTPARVSTESRSPRWRVSSVEAER